MTITPDAPSHSRYTLSELAWGQLDGCGLSIVEVYRLIRQPEVQRTLPSGSQLLSGYGLVLELTPQSEVARIMLDGADASNWQDWAAERAYFKDGDLAGAEALVRRELAPGRPLDPLTRLEREAMSRPAPVVTEAPPAPVRPAAPPVQRRFTKNYPVPTEPRAGKVVVSHVMDQIHPALRAEIARQVAGDWSRVVVHSSTKVTVNPPS